MILITILDPASEHGPDRPRLAPDVRAELVTIRLAEHDRAGEPTGVRDIAARTEPSDVWRCLADATVADALRNRPRAAFVFPAAVDAVTDSAVAAMQRADAALIVATDTATPGRADVVGLVVSSAASDRLASLAVHLGARIDPASVDVDIVWLDRPPADVPAGLHLRPDLPYDDIMVALHNESAGVPAAPHPMLEPEAFVGFCMEAQFGGYAPIPRYFVRLRAARHDLLVAYPEVPGRDAGEFIEWIRVFGAKERGVVPLAAALPAPPAATARYDQPGVNLAGLFTSELGMGEVARRLADALRSAHVPFAPVTFVSEHHRPTRPAPRIEPVHFDTDIVCLNADSLPEFTQQVGRDFYTGRTTVGVWFWETAQFPSMFHGAFETVDEVWAASDFLADVFRSVAPDRVDVVRFPLPIVEPLVAPDATRSSLALPEDRFVFLTSFDYRSVAARKNPHGAIRAFCRAFDDGEGPMLVVKSTNEAVDPHAAAQLRELARGRSDIRFLDSLLDAPTNAALLANADCFVSLHRSEGFGFNLADALALGVPLIATAATGNLAFCRREHVHLIPAAETNVGEGNFPYEPDATWFEPDLDAAVAAMLAVAADPEAARARAAIGRAWVLDAFSPRRTGEFARNRLAARRAARATVAPAPVPPPEPAASLVGRARAWMSGRIPT